jgi:division protein CdvB (Snf7/Vps24/ESCRT-III family)
VHSIKNQISGVIPEVGFELSEIGEVLNGFVLEAGEATGSAGYDMEASGTEAQRIMSEANAIAEQHMKERFPDLPASGLASPQRAGEASFTR